MLTTKRYRVTLNRLHQFFSKVRMTDQCWIWTGATTTGGYGSFGGTSAHRFAYWWMVRPIPEGLNIDHLCRNHRCVNPVHLEAVTQKVNVQRAEYVRLRPMSAFADRLGIKESALRRLLQGKSSNPGVGVAMKINRATGISLRQMADGQLPVLLSKHFAKFKDTQAQETTSCFDVVDSSLQVLNDGAQHHDV